MKLVELLARELAVWPTDGFNVKYLTQDSDGWIASWEDDGPLIFSDDHWKIAYSCPVDQLTREELAEDYNESVVTRAQWQAERDRQKGGEWKRHRGGKCPVPAGTKVSTRYRDGEVVDVHFQTAEHGTHKAAMDIVWKHDGSKNDIMAYKVLNQPEAKDGLELVQGAKDAVISCVGPFPGAPEGEPLNQLERDIQFPSGVCSVESKTEQMETPFKWRDQVTELNAYIEKFTRERDELIERLASEGFALIDKINSSLDKIYATLDMSDWRNWKAGDIVECLTSGYPGVYTKGNQYTVEWVKDDSFSVFDDIGGTSSCDWFDDEAEGLKFIIRP
jgi:hypothetical protein